jgi:DNA-binding NarL/FixJ family response regulator
MAEGSTVSGSEWRGEDGVGGSSSVGDEAAFRSEPLGPTERRWARGSAESRRRVAILTPIRLLAQALEGELRRSGVCDVVEQATSAEELLPRITEGPSDLLLLYDGSTSARVRELPQILDVQGIRYVVVFGLGETAQDALVCAELGIPGLVSRDASLEQLLSAIETVGHGGVFMSPPIRDALVHASGGQRLNGISDLLTPREREVATLLAAGLRNKQIARALKAGEGTVKVHVRHIMAKLQVNHRVDVEGALHRAAARASPDACDNGL